MKNMLLVLLCLLLALPIPVSAESSVTPLANVYGRNSVSLNGEWRAIADIYDRGEKMGFHKNLKPCGNDDFYEYSFDEALILNVPGDWNSQYPEFKYYEGTIWYARHFDAPASSEGRQFLYFAGVSYRCKVFLNGEQIASHEGSFFPFQVEVTGKLLDRNNFLAVEVNNRRTEDAIPALDFDWWNYGGITRDVMLVSTPDVYVNDWFLSLDRDDQKRINVQVTLSEPGERCLSVEIPELKIKKCGRTDAEGVFRCSVKSSKISYWSPSSPKTYKVIIRSGEDTVSDEIGFRDIRVDGTSILLNGKPFFAKSVSFHEEIPQRMGRACTAEDAAYLIGEAKALGANMVRLAHYPQNEYIVRLAEREGIVLWEEIPLWQKIKFSDEATLAKALDMYSAMLYRDRNRCNICFWGIANETRPAEDRNAFLTALLDNARSIDNTRLYTLADDIADYNPESGIVEMSDPMIDKVDVVAINKYLGWYAKWTSAPADMKWNVAPGKPLIISEFGGEALFGRHGDENVASSWSEEYQAKLYRDNLAAFANIDNLAGISPWVLFDFRSPRRCLPGLQDGWNRKGLLSDQGERKMSWYIISEYYRHK